MGTLVATGIPEPDTPMWRQVDDAFFVLARCGRRALGTASAACVCAVLGQANALLGSALSPQLRARLEVRVTTEMRTCPVVHIGSGSSRLTADELLGPFTSHTKQSRQSGTHTCRHTHRSPTVACRPPAASRRSRSNHKTPLAPRQRATSCCLSRFRPVFIDGHLRHGSLFRMQNVAPKLLAADATHATNNVASGTSAAATHAAYINDAETSSGWAAPGFQMWLFDWLMLASGRASISLVVSLRQRAATCKYLVQAAPFDMELLPPPSGRLLRNKLSCSDTFWSSATCSLPLASA